MGNLDKHSDTNSTQPTADAPDVYMKIRRELFNERVDKLRITKWQIPYKSKPNIKGLSMFYGYPEMAVEEFIIRLELAAGLSAVGDKAVSQTAVGKNAHPNKNGEG
jgi:hypothetical protein